MATTTIKPDRSRFSLWVQAARPFVLSGSVVPVLLGAACALLFHQGPINWALLPIAIFGAMLFHTGGNFVSEYFDYKANVDRKDTYGSSKVLVDGLLEPKSVLAAGYLFFAVGFALGLILVAKVGLPILYLGLIGLIGGMFYSAKPFQFKFIAMGDIIIFFVFGPILSMGSYMALTETWNWNVVWMTIPLAFLIVGVVHANNTRDMMHDTQAGIKTLASIFGVNGAKFEYYFLIIGAYLFTIGLIVFGLLDLWGLIVFLSLPPAIKNLKTIKNASYEKPEDIITLDVTTAQHHMMFGLLFTISIILTKLL